MFGGICNNYQKTVKWLRVLKLLIWRECIIMRCHSGLVHFKTLNMRSCTTEVGKLNTIISQPPLQLGLQVWLAQQSDALTWAPHSEQSNAEGIRFFPHEAGQAWCGAGAGKCSHLPNPAGSFPRWQAASWLFQKQQLLWQPSCDALPGSSA